MSLNAKMDETHIDDRIDASARFGDVQSSPTRSPLHLASLSSDPLGSPYTAGSPNTASAGLGISLRDSVRDELLRELRQELFADMRSELLGSKQETAVVQQENVALRQRIEDLESASVLAPNSHTSTPVSPANTPLDQPAEYLISHSIDPVISPTQLVDFTSDEARWALFQSNNDLDASVEILLSCPPVPSVRIRLEEYRPPRGRGRGGHIPQLSRSSVSANPVHHQHSVPLADSSSVRDDQMSSTLGKLTDVIGNLGTLITDNMSRNAGSTGDSKQRLRSDHKFDTSKIHPYTGEYTLGAPHEYWLCPGSRTKHFRNLMLICTISHDH